MIGSVGGLVGTGYAAASYYSQKRAEKEAKRREQDLEAAIGGVAAKIENDESERSRRGSGGSSQAGSTEVKVPEPEPFKREDLTWTGMR